jgi:hypothetical protein
VRPTVKQIAVAAGTAKTNEGWTFLREFLYALDTNGRVWCYNSDTGKWDDMPELPEETGPKVERPTPGDGT